MPITAIALRRNYPGDDVIDEIAASDVNIALRQTNPYAIACEIRELGSARRFRFVSAQPGQGPGLQLLRRLGEPPGARLTRAGLPDAIAACAVRQGNIHIERMGPDWYWISLGDNVRGCCLKAFAPDDGSINLVEVVRSNRTPQESIP